MEGYVTVFGDQSLFKLAPYDAEIVDEGMYYYKRSEGSLLRFYRNRWVVTKMFKRKPIAERKPTTKQNTFIPTNEFPKRYTMKDYRNKKVPDYNAVGVNNHGLKVEFLGLGMLPDTYCVRYLGGRCELISVTDFLPFETEVEKYEREREEVALSIIRLGNEDPRNYFKGLLDMYDYCHDHKGD